MDPNNENTVPQDAIHAIVADLHAGGTTALCTEWVDLLTGGWYRPSYLQGVIRQQWLEYINAVKVARQGKRLIVTFNGDLIDGYHHRSVEIITPLKNVQRNIAIELIDEFLVGTDFDTNKGDALRFTMGTGAHAGQTAHDEEVIAMDFGDVVTPHVPEGSDAKARILFPEVKLSINGYKHFIRHQGPSVSKRVHLEDGGLYRFMKNEFFSHKIKGSDYADVYTFSHRHNFVSSIYTDGHNGVEIQGCITPSWQMRTHYAVPLASQESFGGVYYEYNVGEKPKLHVVKSEFEQSKYEVA